MVTIDGKTGDISCGGLRLSDIAIGGRDGQVCCYTQTENIKHFAERVVNEFTVRMLSGCAKQVVIGHEILRVRMYRFPSRGHLLAGGLYIYGVVSRLKIAFFPTRCVNVS